jgi:AAA domain
VTSADVLKVLRTWYLIEMLSPNGVKVQKRMLNVHTHVKANYKVEDLPEMPWEVREQELSLPDLVDEESGDETESELGDPDSDTTDEGTAKVEGYIFYLGIVSLAEAYKAIRVALKAEESFLDGQQRANAYCALASVRVTMDGLPVRDSLTISTLPWYLGRIKEMGLGQVLTEPVGRGFDAFTSQTRDGAFAGLNPQFGSKDLVALADFVVNACDAEEIPWTYAFAGNRERFDPKEPPGLLNSFFHEDIADAIGLLGRSRLPALITTLFGESERKIDIYGNESHIKTLLRPETISRSAWPSDNRLALMQQAAVSAACSPDARHIVSVNGPPGTGKTTLLRSFIAENIVMRAKELAKFDQPSSAWTKIKESVDKDPDIYALAESLTGFEMLVSSNNNVAIENITKDVPLEMSVGGYEAVLAEIDHFASVALNIANHGRKATDTIVRTWGLLSAALGSKGNRTAFIEPLMQEARADVTEGVETIHGFVAHNGHIGWNAARREFQTAYDALATQIGARNEPDQSWESLCDEERQLRSPFVDQELNLLQINVFLKALVLHRSFVHSTWPQMCSNLTAWSRLAVRPRATDLTQDEATMVWKSFFLICPVVSTTFASARRMLAGVSWSSLGWALIDEAGQATPQSAMGVLLRCKRAMVVGDPLQLEPIVTLSQSIVRLIVETYDANPSYVASPDNGESLQTLADRCSVHGTSRPVDQPDGSKKDQWVGVPLVVHRRCLDPMFSISNKLYDNAMIPRVYRPDNLDDRQPLGESAWIDVAGTSSPHTVLEQIDLAKDMILALFSYYRKRYVEIDRSLSPALSKEDRGAQVRPWKEPSVSIITPFRQIEEELQERLDAYNGLGRWAGKHIGTIHKFQGREAETVILVLGLDKEHAPAATFATSKPNMMNVAVTRAKHRLYVIGNSSVWGDAPYFRGIFQEMLDHKSVRTNVDFRRLISGAVPFFDLYAPSLKKPKKPRKARTHSKT